MTRFLRRFGSISLAALPTISAFAAGKGIDPGVVVVRGGVIETVVPVGTTAIPADARVTRPRDLTAAPASGGER